MLDWLQRYQFVVLLIAALILAGGLAYRAASDDAPSPFVFHETPEIADGTPIRVHVAGAVARPGVYELHSGDRVDAALESAGGATSDADLDALNLARRLRD